MAPGLAFGNIGGKGLRQGDWHTLLNLTLFIVIDYFRECHLAPIVHSFCGWHTLKSVASIWQPLAAVCVTASESVQVLLGVIYLSLLSSQCVFSVLSCGLLYISCFLQLTVVCCRLQSSSLLSWSVFDSSFLLFSLPVAVFEKRSLTRVCLAFTFGPFIAPRWCDACSFLTFVIWQLTKDGTWNVSRSLHAIGSGSFTLSRLNLLSDALATQVGHALLSLCACIYYLVCSNKLSIPGKRKFLGIYLLILNPHHHSQIKFDSILPQKVPKEISEDVTLIWWLKIKDCIKAKKVLYY